MSGFSPSFRVSVPSTVFPPHTYMCARFTREVSFPAESADANWVTRMYLHTDTVQSLEMSTAAGKTTRGTLRQHTAAKAAAKQEL